MSKRGKLLKDICCAQSSNIALKDLIPDSGPYPIYGASGLITHVNFYKIESPYVGVVKDGAGVGRVMELPAQSSVIGTMQYIIPAKDTDVKYLSYLLDFLNLGRFCSGATIPHIYFKDYGREPIPTHSPEQQKKIAATLNKIVNLTVLRRQQLAKLEQLAKSRFIEMFGDPVKNSKAWSSSPLGNLTDIVRGGSPRPIDNFLGGTIPWIKIGDATQGDDIYLHSTKDHIIEQGLAKTRFIKSGSLIFANCGVSLGFARIIKFDGCIHDGWLALGNISDRLNKIFLLKSLNHCTDFFRHTAPDGTQPNLNTSIMKNFVQIVPPIELQNEFAAFIEQLDKSKVTIRKSIEKLETTYRALLQEYFG